MRHPSHQLTASNGVFLATMKEFSGTVIAVCLGVLLLCSPAHAQSGGREKAAPGGKVNQRPEPSAPSPTPLPQIETVNAGTDDSQVEDGEVIKVNTQLVSVPIRVMDKKGRFIGGLKKENFKVFEDAVEQEVALFSNEHQPFTVALVLDMSMSATFKVAEIQNAAIAFIDQLRPDDKVMVVSFDEEVHILCEPTDDRKAIYRAIKSTKIATGTSIYEALDLVMNDRFRRVEGRKAIILFSDGVDTTSRRSHDLANLNDAMELDSLIYPIRYDTFADVQRMKNGTSLPPQSIPTIPGQSTIPGGASTIPGNFPTIGGVSIPIPLPPIASPSSQGTTVEEYSKAEEYLNQLALRTGGRLYQASSLGSLSDAYTKIASELREFYSIGYYPNRERVSGKQTKVKVKVDQPGMVVRSREGYIRRKESKRSS
jgi:VWFA-related protein